MASNIDPSLGSLIDPQQAVGNALSSGNGFATGAQQGIKTAMQLATVQDEVQQKKLQTQQMQEQLDTMKFNKLTNSMSTLARANPTIAKKMVDPIYQQLQNSGVAVDKLYLENLASDEEHRKQWTAISQSPAFKAFGADPDSRMQVMQGIQNYVDPTGQGTGFDKMMQLAQHVNQADMNSTYKGLLAQQRGERLDQTTHARNISDINKDTGLNQLQTTFQNLNNAKTLFEKGGATPQEFAELQQAVRSNLGIKGGSGVDERSETYLKSIGINKDKLVQFLSGNPQSVLKDDPKFANQVLGLVDIELKNKQSQASSQIQRLGSTHAASFYNKPGREDYRSDLMNTMGQRMGQFGLDPSGKPMPNAGSLDAGAADKIKQAIGAGYSPEEVAAHLSIPLNQVLGASR